ncbi:MAG: aminomethyltransferase family protein, partial [Chloroflexota bacterium]
MAEPLHTPLEAAHRSAGAKFMEFGGWLMPLQYSGIVEEHRAVRARAGLFDISHMGKIEVRGQGGPDFIQRMTPNDTAKLSANQAQYSFLLAEDGGVIDDIIVYRLEDRLLLIVNAAGRGGDLAWLREHAPAGVELTDKTEELAMLAVQGPASQELLQPLAGADLASLSSYHACPTTVAGIQTLVLRTGYT